MQISARRSGLRPRRYDIARLHFRMRMLDQRYSGNDDISAASVNLDGRARFGDILELRAIAASVHGNLLFATNYGIEPGLERIARKRYARRTEIYRRRRIYVYVAFLVHLQRAILSGLDVCYLNFYNAFFRIHPVNAFDMRKLLGPWRLHLFVRSEERRVGKECS